MHYSIKTTNSELEVAFIQRRLERSKKYLEFGAGASTLMASQVKRLKTMSIETDPQFISYLKNQLPPNYLDENNSSIMHVDIGPVGEWGWPIDIVTGESLPRYLMSILCMVNKSEFEPDLILIDGRFRIATFFVCLLSFPGSTILFDDYVDRINYHVVEEVIKPKRCTGRIGEFKVPRRLKKGKLSELVVLLLKYAHDPS
jgi:hypothetical protein